MGNELTTGKDEFYIRSVFDIVDRGKDSPQQQRQRNTNSPYYTTLEEEQMPNQKERTRFDLSPKNMNIAVYCRSLINVNFTGQCSLPDDMDSCGLVQQTDAQDGVNLAEALCGIDELLRSVNNDFSGHEEEFQYYLHACMEARDASKGTDSLYRMKFMQDARQFARIYKNRQSVSEMLNHREYWATRQQMLSGKVVADWIDPEYGPLDPVFGCLLNPTLGRTGPGDSGLVHKILFDDTGPMAYHSAVHDAFGYLITFHNSGPGYDYLGAWSLFESHTPMAGQLSGLKFWKTILKENDNIPNHTILLIQPNPKLETRTYSDFESIDDCLEGVCKIYEEHLKRKHPDSSSITYDISQLFDFIDQLTDLSCL
eukprot:gene20205-22181_t